MAGERPRPEKFARLDAAWERITLVRRIVMLQRGSADDARLLDVGRKLELTPQGMRREDALRKVKSAFDDMDWQIERQALIELCAAFETTFRERLPTAIGEATGIVKDRYNFSLLASVKHRLLIAADDVDSLREMFSFLVSNEAERGRALASLREARNTAAHDLHSVRSPSVTPERAYELLHALINDFF
jgi:hypothetical protein